MNELFIAYYAPEHSKEVLDTVHLENKKFQFSENVVHSLIPLTLGRRSVIVRGTCPFCPLDMALYFLFVYRTRMIGKLSDSRVPKRSPPHRPHFTNFLLVEVGK